jgi:hypothetical protein
MVPRVDEQYIVVVKATSAAQLPPGHALILDVPDGQWRIQNASAGASSLRGEMRGPATDLNDAYRRMPMRIGGAFGWLLLVANATIGDEVLVVAHGLQPRGDAVNLIAYETPSLTGQLPLRTRTVDPDLVVAVMQGGDRYAAVSSEAGAYYSRAVGRYRDALKYWTYETGLLAGEFLWLSAEVLSRALVEAEAASKRMTPKNLAQSKKVNGPDQLYRRARKQTIFLGEEDALEALEAASHGFEHGYGELDSVRQQSGPILRRAARCVRRALIKALNLPAAVEAAILDPSIEEPLPILPEMRAIAARVRVTDADVAPETIKDAIEVNVHFRAHSQTEGTFRYDPLNVPLGMEFDPATLLLQTTANLSLEFEQDGPPDQTSGDEGDERPTYMCGSW